jgi:hypothetical protein
MIWWSKLHVATKQHLTLSPQQSLSSSVACQVSGLGDGTGNQQMTMEQDHSICQRLTDYAVWLQKTNRSGGLACRKHDSTLDIDCTYMIIPTDVLDTIMIIGIVTFFEVE